MALGFTALGAAMGQMGVAEAAFGTFAAISQAKQMGAINMWAQQQMAIIQMIIALHAALCNMIKACGTAVKELSRPG